MSLNKVQTLFGVNPILEKATADNDVPTPGYLYSEICKLTFQGAKECERLRSQLLSKLKGTSPAVRIKTLVILKHLLDNGHPHFQTMLQMKVEDIKPCVDYKAPLDPLHGDAPARLVREKASTVINALYEKRTDVNYEYNHPASAGGSTPGSSSGSNTYQSGTYSGSTSSTSSGSSIIFAGKGPTSIEGPKPVGSIKKPGVMESLKGKVEQTFRSSRGSGNSSGTTPSPSKFKPLGGPVSYPRGVFVGNTHTTQSAEQAFVDVPRDAGRPGGGWDTLDDDNQDDVSGYEADLVNQICNPGNKPMPTPTRQQLQEFVTKATQGDPLMAAYCLAQQLTHQNWKNRLRALYVIHELLIIETPGVKEYFAEEAYSLLAGLSSSVQKTIRDKVALILGILPTPSGVHDPSLLNPDISLSVGIEENFTEEIAEDGGLFANLSISCNQEEPVINVGEESLFVDLIGSTPQEPSPIANVPPPTQTLPSPLLSNSTPVSSVRTPTPSNLPTSAAAPTPAPIPGPSRPSSTPNKESSEQLLSEIFNPTIQNKNAARDINTLFNMTDYQAGYAAPPYGYPAAPPYYPYYGMYPPGTVPGYFPQTQMYTYGTGTTTGTSTSVNSTSSGGAFDFVAKDTQEKKDPFDFIKVGQ